MTKNGYDRWNSIRVVDENPDYWVIINSPPPDVYYDASRTILFQMEPNMKSRPDIWGEWSNPRKEDFLKVIDHDNDYNNVEWHISTTFDFLKTQPIQKDVSLDKRVSTILSNKYKDEGQVKRIDFVKYIENDVDVDVFGSNQFEHKNYKGTLPYHQKENGLFPYRYTFNCENNSIDNYFSEKLVDAILSECLCFYWGCPNVGKWIDERAFIRLDMNDFDKSREIIQQSIKNDEWPRHGAR